MALACSTEHEYKQWVTAVGKGGGALYGDMPMYGALYKRMAAVGVDSKLATSLLYSDSGFARMSAKPRCHEVRDVSDDCRISFYRAFGIPPCQQITMERFYAQLTFNNPVPCPGVGWGVLTILYDQLGN
jgi:hypothetical protein